MDAREVLTKALRDAGLDNVNDDDAPFIISALTIAGFRVLAPGELDKVTLERAAGIAKAFADSQEIGALSGLAESTGVGSPGWRKDAMHSHAQEVAGDIAAAILADDGGRDE